MGYALNNATTSGVNVSIVYVPINKENIWACVPLYDGSNPKIKITHYVLEIINNKSTRSTSYTPTSPNGKSRYIALKELYDSKYDYFPAEYMKSTCFNMTAKSSSAWAYAYDTKTYETDRGDGKILGVTHFGYNGTGMSFVSTEDAYISSGVNSTIASITMGWHGGNKGYTSTAGNALTNVYPNTCIFSISEYAPSEK